VTSVGKLRRAWGDMVRAVREDHGMMHRYDVRYAADLRGRAATVASDVVTRVGFQMLVAYRMMRFCVEAEIPVAPRVGSRLIRHLYGSDLHWDARLEPGIVIVHGMGLSISHAACVQRGTILFQNVTLGMGTDPQTRKSGAPTLERDVHIGPGTTIIGPVTVGTGTKVTANCLVRASVPAHCIVEAPAPTVTPRVRHAPANDVGSGV